MLEILKPFLIALREGFEMTLIVGILYTYVAAKKEARSKSAVWFGVAAAAVLSVAFAVGLEVLQANISEEHGELMEGILMFVACGFLLYMVLWMNHSGISKELRTAVDTTASPVWGIFSIAFFSVLREGLETALFLHSAHANEPLAYLGALLGFAAAAGLGYLLFAQGSKLPMKQIFSYTSILLVVFAAWLGFVAFKPCGIYFYGDESPLPVWLHVVRSIVGLTILVGGTYLWRNAQTEPAK
jgi:high-affinity iron transporter